MLTGSSNTLLEQLGGVELSAFPCFPLSRDFCVVCQPAVETRFASRAPHACRVFGSAYLSDAESPDQANVDPKNMDINPSFIPRGVSLSLVGNQTTFGGAQTPLFINWGLTAATSRVVVS